MIILVLNSGSSTQKACLYEIGEFLPDHPPGSLWEGKIEWNGDLAEIAVKSCGCVVEKEQVRLSTREGAVGHLLGTLVNGKTRVLSSSSEIDVVGHRVVHGCPYFEETVRITEANMRPVLDQDISTADSRVRVLVIRAEEDWAIAKECWKLAQPAAAKGQETELLRGATA